MPPPSLAGPPGECIKRRLESAAGLFEQAINWEDLRLYILQDEKWDWDGKLLLRWQNSITEYYLDCCRPYHSEDTVECFAAALKDGQQLEESTKRGATGDQTEGGSDHGTIKRPEFAQTGEADRASFVISWDPKRYGGIKIGHTTEPRSRINDEVVRDRWKMEDQIYEVLVFEGTAQRMLSFIDLTWKLPTDNGEEKLQTTTFEVDLDNAIKPDAEFGQNKFHPTYHSQRAKGHSGTKSLSSVATSRDASVPTLRDDIRKSSSSNSHRRQTAPSAPSTLGRSENLSREEFIRREVVAGLTTYAEMNWEKHEQPFLDSDGEDDESYAGSRRRQHSSPNTSVSSKKSNLVDRRKR